MSGKMMTEKTMITEIQETIDIIVCQYPEDINIAKLSDLIKRFIKKTGRKRTSRPVENTGLGMPRKLTKDVADFIGTENASRIDVNSAVCAYVKENNLQKSDQRKMFYIDNKLSKLFELKEHDLLSYQDFQKVMKRAFVNSKDIKAQSVAPFEPVESQENFVAESQENFVAESQENFVAESQENFVAESQENFVAESRKN